MSNYNFIIAIVIILGVCGAASFGFNFLKKKGVKVDTILEGAKEATEDAGIAIQAGKSLSNDPIFNKLDLIDRLAREAVGTVQQLYISSQLPVGQRKAKAKEIMQNGLKEANIKETPEIGKLEDMAIEYSVYNFKTDAEKKGQEQNTLQKQNADLQTTINQLTTDKAALQKQVQDLTSKFNTVQATLTPVSVAK